MSNYFSINHLSSIIIEEDRKQSIKHDTIYFLKFNEKLRGFSLLCYNQSAMKHIINFVKKETVFCVSFALALMSFFLVPPSPDCINGIDFRVLALLFCLMAVVAGLQKILVFRRIGNSLLGKLGSTRPLYLLLIYLCFFSAMFLTNDVALITFVPFAIMLIPMVNKTEKLITIVVLQTIAANLGSVLTPLGNPQNLYLYTVSGMNLVEFMMMMLPLWILSLVLVTIPILLMKNEPISNVEASRLPARRKDFEFIYCLLFLLCLLTVVDVLPYYILLAVIIIVVAISDHTVFGSVDYMLLLTFVCFFLFIYNMKQIPEVVTWLSSIVEGRVFIVGVLTSQIISNVPAALLLSGFTDDFRALTLAVDAGGLGTLIASLASLISFKLYSAFSQAKKGKYLAVFTAYNIVYLIIVIAFILLIQ